VFSHLSVWQFQRAEEKMQFQQIYDIRRQSPPIELSAVDIQSGAVLPGTINGLNVKLSGFYFPGQFFLLDNRVLNRKVGFEVISPLQVIDETWDLVLVNRGWVEMGRTRNDAVKVKDIPGRVESRGWIYVPDGEMLSLQDNESQQVWPEIIQDLNVQKMAARLSSQHRVFPYVVRLEESETGAFARHWPPVNMRPEKHTGYAFQWLLMAIAVTIAYCWASFKKSDKRG
jgi:surfeit locus 1 family protein